MKTGMRRGILSVCLATLFVTLSAAVASAQHRPHFGVHAGYNADGDAGLVGLQLSLPLVERLEFYPSFDAYFPNRGTQLGFNADLKYRAPTSSSLWLYGGGGLGVQYRNVDSVSNSDLGVNLLGGLETRVGNVHPFFEARVMLYDNSAFQVMGGLNITLYGTR